MANPQSPRASLSGLLVVLLLAIPLCAQGQSLDRLAEKLVRLRGEVEELNNKLQGLREQHKNEMSSLSRQKSDLESTIQKRQVELEELQNDLAEKRKKAKQAGMESTELRPVINDAISELKDRIREGLPFKRNKRIGELDEIQEQMASEVLTPHKAAKRLWGFYEDELRLSEGSGIYQQTITLNGEQKLADVARLGMVMMFFQTPNERYGRVVEQGGEWHYQVLSDPAAKDRVKNLFASFRKQIRTGYFTVPNTLTGEEGLE